MSLTRNQLIIIGGVIIFVIALVMLFIFGGRQNSSGQFSGTLTFWGIDDGSGVFEQTLADYRKAQPKLDIRYRQLDADTYEDQLINGLASAQGPDLFMFPNTWLPKHFDKLQPLSDGQLSMSEFRRLFPTVVEQDFAPDGVIFALPLYLDTLAMFYNQDIFDSRGIAGPPTTWLEFQNLVPKLRQLDKAGQIVRPAAAIGGSNRSVDHAADLLNALMLQSGVPMVTNDFSRADFSKDGVKPLQFYTQFADARSPYYTWNDSFPYSIDNFSDGNAAIIFNYSSQIATIKERNPLLRFAIAPLPQPSEAKQNINWANYLGLAVSAKSPNGTAAWNFIQWLTTNPNNSLSYLKSAKRPPALRSLLAQYANDSELGVFAGQALSARSWPEIDSAVISETFSDMIAEVTGGRASADKALLKAESKVTDLMQKRLR